MRLDHLLGLAAEAAPSRVDKLEHHGVTWVFLDRPGAHELAFLGDDYQLHALELEDLVSKTERPKIDRYPEHEFVVMHFPVVLARPRRLAAGELHLVVGANYVVTVHDGDLRPLVRLFDELRDDPVRRAEEMSSPGRLAYRIVTALIDGSAPVVERLGGQLETLYEDVFGRPSRDLVRQIALARREVIQLRRMLRPGPTIVTALGSAPFAAAPELANYWSDAHDQLQRLVDYLDDVWQTLEAISHSYEQISNQRLNSLMRALTLISTTMLPLAVVSSIYGMNIKGLPWAESEWAFEITLGIMLLVVLLMLALFRRRRWI